MTAGRPSLLAAVAALFLGAALSVAGAACSGGGDTGPAPTATPSPATATASASAVATPSRQTTTAATATPTASPSPTPAPTPPSGAEDITDNGYRVFLAKLDAALRAKDLAFLGTRLKATPYVCQPEDIPRQLGGPACETAGKRFNGVLSSTWRSSGGLVPIESVTAHLASIIAALRPASKDAYGDGSLTVYALGTGGRTAVTGIRTCPADFACPANGDLRFVLVFEWRFEDGQWSTRSMMTANVLAEDFLLPSAEGKARLGGSWTRYGQSPALAAEVRAAIQTAVRVFPEAKTEPDCIATTPCIQAFDPGSSLAAGIIKLSYTAPAGVGSAALFFAKDQTDTWQYWFGAQQATHRLTEMPGLVMVCADGDGLNVRAGPASVARSVAVVPDGTTFEARAFVLTEPGTASTAGAGWYRVVTVTQTDRGAVTGEAWVFSRFVSDVRRGNCDTRNALEGPG